jgi:alpha-ribazole phosphatase
MTEIILIRHGETDSNKAGKFSGRADLSLNDKGREQAARLKNILSDCSIERVYSSDMKRCVETGSGLCSDVVFSETLREMDFGHWEGLSFGEIKDKYPEEMQMWKTDWVHYRIPQGESFIDTTGRVVKKFDEIIKENKDAKRIAVVTHGGCIRAILGHYIIGSLKDSWKIFIDNATVTRLGAADGYYFLKSLNEK